MKNKRNLLKPNLFRKDQPFVKTAIPSIFKSQNVLQNSSGAILVLYESNMKRIVPLELTKYPTDTSLI